MCRRAVKELLGRTRLPAIYHRPHLILLSACETAARAMLWPGVRLSGVVSKRMDGSCWFSAQRYTLGLSYTVITEFRYLKNNSTTTAATATPV